MTATPTKGIRLATVDGKAVPPDPRVLRTDQERQLIANYRMQPRAVQAAVVVLARAIVAANREGGA